MKSWLLIMGLAVLPLAAAFSDNTVLPDWFDYRNCDFCKQWGAHQGLIAHSLDENREISDGIVWITYVDKAYRKEYASVMEAEGKVSEDIKAGKPVRLCQACKRITDFGDAGVRMESVAGSDVFITVFTSTDSVQVRKLHEFGAQAMVEEAKANAAFLQTAKSAK